MTNLRFGPNDYFSVDLLGPGHPNAKKAQAYSYREHDLQ